MTKCNLPTIESGREGTPEPESSNALSATTQTLKDFFHRTNKVGSPMATSKHSLTVPLNDSTSRGPAEPSDRSACSSASPSRRRRKFGHLFGFHRNSSEEAARQYREELQRYSEEQTEEYDTPRHHGHRMRLLRSSSTVSECYSENNNHSDGDSSSNSMGNRSSLHSSSMGSIASNTTGEAGLQIYLMDGSCRLGYCYDANYKWIHPNVFGPASLTDVHRLAGGGSGVAVFAGTHPELGDIVMKHGGFKDLGELFALATIAEELKRRGAKNGEMSASLALLNAIPSFEMIYISPQHILRKQSEKEYWQKLKKLIKIGSGHVLRIRSFKRNSSFSLDDEAFLTPGMSIRVYETNHEEISVVLDDKSQDRKASLAFVLPKEAVHFLRTSTMQLDGASDYQFLKMIYEGLLPIMVDNPSFKFTLAQQMIGGQHAKTGNQCLYERRLKGSLLDNLVTQFCEAVRNLQKLSLPDEVDVVEQIRGEVETLENEANPRADQISDLADQFTGNAIRKNFHPTKGRLRFFRRVCKDFREKNLILTPEEEIPAMHLGSLLLDGALMSDTFEGASTEPTMLQPNEHFWMNLFGRAVDNRKNMSPNALKRIWNSGLADAGIHNLFLSEDELFFFDLGQPQLQSMPGFMTKFLFSFFHTLGMQEDENGDWIRRFVIKGDKLGLTDYTKDLLPDAYDAFEFALDQIISDIFDDDQGLRWLLLQYVTLQLLSDASFCLQRWEMKGGGRSRADNHHQKLQKWLWRALWDVYVAFDINTVDSWLRFDVEHPNCRDSIDTVRQSIENSIRAVDIEALQEFRSTLRKSEAPEPLTPPSSSRATFVSGSQGASLRDLTLSTYNMKTPFTLDEISDSDAESDAESDDSRVLPPVPGIHL